MADNNGKENFQGVVEALLKGMDTVLSTKTVVGEATHIGDTIILPLAISKKRTHLSQSIKDILINSSNIIIISAYR